MDVGSEEETIPAHSPGGTRCLSPMNDSCSAATTASGHHGDGHHGDGFGRRRRCVTMSVLPDVVALDTEDEEEEEDEGEEENGEEKDVLWMGSKDGAGVEMRARSKTSPACMRWYVERQVGRSLRRISDDFVTNLDLRQVVRVGNVQQSDVSPRQPEVQADSHPLPVTTDGSLPVTDGSLPVSSSSSRDSLWSRMSSYFHPERGRMQSNRANTNVSNVLPTGETRDEVFMAGDVDSLRTVARQ